MAQQPFGTAPDLIEEYGGAVVVVPDRPRYHVEDCRHVAGRDVEDVDIRDARNEGYTPCAICRPDDALLVRAEARAAAAAASAEQQARRPVSVPRQAGPSETEQTLSPDHVMMPAAYAPPGPYTTGGPQQVPHKGSGLAITAFVVAVLALLLCWVPIVNNLAAVIALIGLAFGVPALVSARRGRRSGHGLALASVIISVLAIIGVFVTQALYVAAIDSVSESIDEAVQDAEDSAAGLGVAQDADDQAVTQTAPALLVGQPAQVGDYTVTVTRIQRDAGGEIAEANEFNDTAKNSFVLVDATVTYNGSEEGTPWIDLVAAIAGGDGRQYDDGATSVVTPLNEESMVTLTKGGTSRIDFVMDIPPSALDGARVVVEESFSLDEDKAFWSIG